MFIELKKNQKGKVIGYEVIAENEAEVYILDNIKKMYSTSQVSLDKSESFDNIEETFKLRFID